MAIFAPASARPSAKARPQPRAPPVTNAVRPLSENWMLSESESLPEKGETCSIHFVSDAE